MIKVTIEIEVERECMIDDAIEACQNHMNIGVDSGSGGGYSFEIERYEPTCNDCGDPLSAEDVEDDICNDCRLEEIRNDGRMAATEGCGSDANPYLDDGGEEHDAWQEGYEEEMRNDQAGLRHNKP